MNSLTGAYVPGRSPLHRLPAGVKLGVLALACTALVLMRSPLALAGAAATPMRAAAAMTDVVTRRSMRDSFTWLFIVSARPEGTDRSHATHGATCGDFTERSPASWRRCADNLPTSVADPSKLYRAYGPAPESERGERHSPGNLPGGGAHHEWGVHLP